MKNNKENYETLAIHLVDFVGGKENIKKVIHCVTRLRFYLNDYSLPNKNKLENLDGVMGIVETGGQFQVVVGQAVDDIFAEVTKHLNNSEDQQPQQEEIIEQRTGFDRLKYGWSQLIGIITGSIMPVISILAASGIIKSILAILTTTNLIGESSSAYLIINAMSDSVFYFLPILIGFNAANRIGGNPVLTAVIGGVLIYPTILEAASNDLNILILGNFNFPFVAYTNSIFPMILAAWLVKKLEIWLRKRIPVHVRSLFVPMFVIGIVSAITFLFTGPVITWLSQAVATGLQILLNINFPIFGAIVDGFYQILVVFGLHWGLIPLYVNDFATQGHSYLSAIVSMPAIAQGGAALAVAVKSKKSNIKSLGYAGALSAFSGITEPAIYGINLRFRKPFICASVASAVSGFLTGLFRINMWSIMGSVIGLPSFIDPVNGITANFWYAVLVTIITLVLSFVLTYIWGYDDTMEMAERKEKPKNITKNIN